MWQAAMTMSLRKRAAPLVPTTFVERVEALPEHARGLFSFIKFEAGGK